MRSKSKQGRSFAWPLLSTFFVSHLLEFLLLCVTLVLNLLVSLACPSNHLDVLLCLQLLVLALKEGKSGHHGMDLFLLLIQMSLLEWSLGWQIESLQQIGLSLLINRDHIIHDRNLLLLFEGQVLSDWFWHLHTGKDSFISFSVNVLIVVFVNRVLLESDRNVALLPQLRVRLQHSHFAIRDDWIAQSWNLDIVPSPTENDITLQDLVFKSGPKGTCLPFFDCSLDLSTNTWHCL